MSLGVFSTLKPDNPQAIREWQLRHDAYHQAYGTLTGADTRIDLTGQMNADWFSVHLLEHRRLVAYAQSSTPTAMLDVSELEDEAAWYWFHFHHNRIHDALDKALGTY